MEKTWLLSRPQVWPAWCQIANITSIPPNNCLHTHSPVPVVFKMLGVTILTTLLVPALSSAQTIKDTSVYGPPLEVVHLYNDQWPTGLANHVLLSSTARLTPSRNHSLSLRP